ncbi:MAG TPA: hypothetical protein PLU80_05965 [Acidobacteriota bacterium]|nr:hypothetical protein [Acidobacteriota bacterium]
MARATFELADEEQMGVLPLLVRLELVSSQGSGSLLNVWNSFFPKQATCSVRK